MSNEENKSQESKPKDSNNQTPIAPETSAAKDSSSGEKPDHFREDLESNPNND